MYDDYSRSYAHLNLRWNSIWTPCINSLRYAFISSLMNADDVWFYPISLAVD